MNKPEPGKFRIRWSGPYEIKEIYDNNTVDVNTLQGEPLGRINMRKIKPYHEPLETNAYILEVGKSTNLSLEENGIGTNKSSFQNNNHHIEESSYSYDKEILRKFYKEQRVVRRYLPYKQGVIPFEQQKWVGSYTITKVHDDNTIQIENIYKKDLGRWRSSKFLLNDWVKPNQVITFDQEVIKTLTSTDYEEMHHKMLEYYFIQPLLKQTSNERSTNGMETMETEGFIIQLLTIGDNYNKKMPYKQPLENSTASILYNFNTTTSIKPNTHVKYKM